MAQRLEDLYESVLESINSGKLNRARKYLAQMTKVDPNDPFTLEAQGDMAKELGEFEEAERFYRELDQSEDSSVRGKAQLSLGYLYREQEKSPQAVEHFGKAVDLFRDSDDPEFLLNCLGALGETQQELGRYRESAATFQTLENEATRHQPEDFVQYIADAKRQRADNLRFLGELSEAIEKYHQVIELAEDEELSFQHANALDGLGVVLQIQGRYEEAEKCHKQALAFNEENGDDEGRSVNLGNLARLNIHLQNWDRAEQFARESLKIDAAEEDINGIGYCQLLLAEIECGRGRYPEAEKILTKVYQLFERHGLSDDLASVISQMGYLYRLQGRLEEAEQKQLEVRKLAMEMGHADGIAATYDELAEIRKAQGRTEEARELWNEALKRYEDLKSSRMISEIKDNLAKLNAT